MKRNYASGYRKREAKRQRVAEAAKDSACLQGWLNSKLASSPGDSPKSNDNLEIPPEPEPGEAGCQCDGSGNSADTCTRESGEAFAQEEQTSNGCSGHDESTEDESDDDNAVSISDLDSENNDSSSESEDEDVADETDSADDSSNKKSEASYKAEELIYFVPPQESDSLQTKEAFRRHHPVQPTIFKGKAVPFDSGKLYYRTLPNGQKIQRQWLSYSTTLNKVFCANCMAFGNSNSQFRTGCHVDVKHVYQNVERHEISECHRLASSAALMACKNLNIDHAINRDLVSKRVREIELRRQVVSRLIDITLFLAKQGLAFRGANKESAYSLDDEVMNHGNFLEMVLFLAEYDPILKDHIKKSIELSKQRKKKHKKSNGRGSLVTFLSKTFINKLIKVIGNYVQQQIFSDLKECKNFSLMVDSTQDVSVMDQLALCVRYVKNDSAYERLINLVVCQDSTGEGLFDILKKEFDTYGLRLLDVVGCSFDGASNMSGIYEGLQAKLKGENPLLVYTHCMAHVLNLVITDCTDTCSLLLILFGLVTESAKFLSKSHKRMNLWRQQTGKRHKKHDKLYTLHNIGATRWWSKHKALTSLFGNIDDLQSSKFVTFLSFLLEIIEGNFDSETKFKARNLIDLWSKFENIFAAIVMLDLFDITSPVSTFLQSKSLDFLQAWNVVDVLISQIKDRRNEQYFGKVYERSKKFVTSVNEAFVENENICLEEDFPKKRVPLKKKFFDEKSFDEARNLDHLTIQRQKFFEVYDIVLGSLRKRFVPNKDLMLDISWLNPKQFNTIKDPLFSFSSSSLETLCKLAKVDKSALTAELKQFASLYDALKSKEASDFNTCGESMELVLDELLTMVLTDDEEEEDEEEEKEIRPDHLKSTDSNCIHCAFKILYEFTVQTGLFNNLYLAYKYILSLPCTQVTCERVFSKLKIIKNRLRSALGQDLLAPLILLAIERDLCKNLNKNVCIDNVAATSPLLKRLLLV